MRRTRKSWLKCDRKPIKFKVGKRVIFEPGTMDEDYFIMGIAEEKCGIDSALCSLNLGCTNNRRWIVLNPRTFRVSEMCVECNPYFIEG